MSELAPLPPGIAAQNTGPVILAVLYPTTILTSMFVAARLFSRRLKLGRWAADDYIISISLVRTTPFSGVHPCPFRSPTGRSFLVDRRAPTTRDWYTPW